MCGGAGARMCGGAERACVGGAERACVGGAERACVGGAERAGVARESTRQSRPAATSSASCTKVRTAAPVPPFGVYP